MSDGGCRPGWMRCRRGRSWRRCWRRWIGPGSARATCMICWQARVRLLAHVQAQVLADVWETARVGRAAGRVADPVATRSPSSPVMRSPGRCTGRARTRLVRCWSGRRWCAGCRWCSRRCWPVASTRPRPPRSSMRCAASTTRPPGRWRPGCWQGRRVDVDPVAGAAALPRGQGRSGRRPSAGTRRRWPTGRCGCTTTRTGWPAWAGPTWPRIRRWPATTGWTGSPAPPARPATRAPWPSCAPTCSPRCWPATRFTPSRPPTRSPARPTPSTRPDPTPTRTRTRSGFPVWKRESGRRARRVGAHRGGHPRRRRTARPRFLVRNRERRTARLGPARIPVRERETGPPTAGRADPGLKRESPERRAGPNPGLRTGIPTPPPTRRRSRRATGARAAGSSRSSAAAWSTSRSSSAPWPNWTTTPPSSPAGDP